MKILHTSDWHLGISLHKHSLIEDQRTILKQFEEIIKKENIDVILISGDIYDTTLASKDAIDVFDEAMRLLCVNLQKQVVLIAGNHDSYTRLAVLKDLLKTAGLHVVGKLEDRPAPLTIQDVDFFCIPYFHTDTIANLYGQKMESQEQAMLALMEDVRSQKQERAQIVLAHCFVNGAQLCESDRFAMIGGADQISMRVFDDIDYVALGHLHRMQKVSERIWYSGSPLAYSFSEVQKKCVLVIDTETMQVTPFDLQPLHHIKVLQGTYEDILEELPKWQDCYSKIILEDMQVSYELLEFFRERAPYLLSLQGTSSVEHEATSIEVEELDTMRDEDIVERFFYDHFQRAMKEEEIAWLQEAKQEVEG